MTLTVSTLTTWQPSGLDEVVTNLRADTQALQSLEDEMMLGGPPKYWVGSDACAARAEHHRLYDRAVDLTAEINTVTAALEAAFAEITAARAGLHAVLETARALHFTVHESGSTEWAGIDATTYVDPEGFTAQHRAQLLHEDARMFLGNAAEADKTLARILEHVALGYYDADGTLAAPGVASPLQALLALDDPTADQAEVINRLLLPDLNSDSADQFMNSVFQASFGLTPGLRERLSTEFADNADSFTRYARWAQEHPGIAMPLTAGQLAWLARMTGRFYPDRFTTDGPVKDSYRTFLGVTDEDLASTLLVLSDEDLGGGYDALPESVRDAAEEGIRRTNGPVVWANDEFFNLARLFSHSNLTPGDALTKVLAGTLASTLHAEATARAQSAKQGFDSSLTSERNQHLPTSRPGFFDDAAMSDLLELISRNREATSDLFTGEGMGSHHDPRELVRTLYTHEWDDNGRGLAKLTDWMHTDRATAAERIDADDTFAAMAKNMSSAGDDGAFADLMGDRRDPATQMNPDATRSLIRALSDHLDEFESDHSAMLNDSDKVRFLTLLASDPENNDLLAASIQARQQDNIDAWLSHDAGERTPSAVLGDRNGRTGCMLDAALFNASAEADYDADNRISDGAALQERHLANRQKVMTGARGLLNSTLGALPGGKILNPGGTALELLLDAPDPGPAEQEIHHREPANVVRGWAPDGSHIAIANGGHMIERLVGFGELDLETLMDRGVLRPAQYDILVNPDGLDEVGRPPGDASIRAAQEAALDSVLSGQESFAHHGKFFDGKYGAYLTAWSQHHASDEKFEEFLSSDYWGEEQNR